MGLVTWLVGKPLVQFAKDPNGFRAWVDTHGIWGRVLYVGMVIFQVLVALIPGEPLELSLIHISPIRWSASSTMLPANVGSCCEASPL